MKKFHLLKIVLCVAFLLSASGVFAKCRVGGDALLAQPNNPQLWCTMECIDEMLDFVKHHSRTSYDTSALADGIYTARTCAWDYYDTNGVSVPYWNDFVDKTNYMLHQAGLIGTFTKNSINSDGSKRSNCALTANTPCPKQYLHYGREVFDFYFACMSDSDKKYVFSQLGCLYMLEAQTGSISAEAEDAQGMLALIQGARSIHNGAGPYHQKILQKITGDMQQTVACRHPELASWKPKKEEKPYELEEVVVVSAPKLKNPLNKEISDKLMAQSCKMSPVQKGDPNEVIGQADANGQAGGKGNGQGNGDGNGQGQTCTYASGRVICSVPY